MINMRRKYLKNWKNWRKSNQISRCSIITTIPIVDESNARHEYLNISEQSVSLRWPCTTYHCLIFYSWRWSYVFQARVYLLEDSQVASIDGRIRAVSAPNCEVVPLRRHLRRGWRRLLLRRDSRMFTLRSSFTKSLWSVQLLNDYELWVMSQPKIGKLGDVTVKG